MKTLALMNMGWPELIIILFIFVFLGLPAILSYIVLNRIPEAHRKQQPALSFLLLIPVFSLAWQFFVYPKISESLKSYYKEKENKPSGDMGAAMALTVCICSLATFVPMIGPLVGLVGLVALIIFFIKVFSLSSNLT